MRMRLIKRNIRERELTISMSQLNYTSINRKLYYKRSTNNKITLIAAVIISDVISAMAI